jgi:hypothetical protein
MVRARAVATAVPVGVVVKDYLVTLHQVSANNPEVDLRAGDVVLILRPAVAPRLLHPGGAVLIRFVDKQCIPACFFALTLSPQTALLTDSNATWAQ